MSLHDDARCRPICRFGRKVVLGSYSIPEWQSRYLFWATTILSPSNWRASCRCQEDSSPLSSSVFADRSRTSKAGVARGRAVHRGWWQRYGDRWSCAIRSTPSGQRLSWMSILQNHYADQWGYWTRRRCCLQTLVSSRRALCPFWAGRSVSVPRRPPMWATPCRRPSAASPHRVSLRR